ncbi:MAG: glycosyltransferase 87 family protein [Chloroflexota bacterium]|nr:glycosyltransferase 87 family protein [Chloroflexota bacterium]
MTRGLSRLSGQGVALWRGWRLPLAAGALRRRALRDGLLLAGWMVGAWIMLAIPAAGRSLGYDAYSYWFVDLAERYALAQDSLYALGAFRYAPPVGLVFGLLATLPWWLFLWLWMALSLGSALWLGGSRAVVILALPPVALELYHGNVHLLMAAAIVLGFRHPWAWAFVLLTKITPGIGLLWFAVRREWRPLAIALLATAAVCVASFIWAPALWQDWLATLGPSASRSADLSVPPSLPVRLAFAAMLVTWGARTDRPWTVGMACMLGLPNLWPHGVVVALAAVPFLGRGRTQQPVAAVSATAGLWSLRRFSVVAGLSVAIALAGALVAGDALERALLWASGSIIIVHASMFPGG